MNIHSMRIIRNSYSNGFAFKLTVLSEKNIKNKFLYTENE